MNNESNNNEKITQKTNMKLISTKNENNFKSNESKNKLFL